jgi:hypothetical protein
MSTKNNSGHFCRSFNNTTLFKNSLEKDDVSSPLSNNKTSLNYTINNLTLDLSKSETKLSTSKTLSDEELNYCEGDFVVKSNENTSIPSSTFRNENRRSNHRNISIN